MLPQSRQMNRVRYIISRFLYFFFSYKVEIIKPGKTKSLRSIPTTYRVKKSTWFTILLGAIFLVVSILGMIIIGINAQPYSMYDLYEFAAIELLLILSFANQIMLKGEIVVSDGQVRFSYRNITGNTSRQEPISNYDCIWIQKYKTHNAGQAHDGIGYSIIYLRHKWNRFRTLFLYDGPNPKDQAEQYANTFNFKTKKSFLTIRKGFIR